MLLPDVNIKWALIVAESIKNAIAELVIPHPDPGVIDHIKFGIGVSTFIPNEEEQPRDLIRKAERSLFDANCDVVQSRVTRRERAKQVRVNNSSRHSL